MMAGASPSTNLANMTAADTMIDLTGMDFGNDADVYQRDLQQVIAEQAEVNRQLKERRAALASKHSSQIELIELDEFDSQKDDLPAEQATILTEVRQKTKAIEELSLKIDELQ